MCICCSMCVQVWERLCRVSHLFSALCRFWGWTRLHGRHLYPVSQAPPFLSFSFLLEAFPRLPISTWDRLWKSLIRRFGWSGEGKITGRAFGCFGGQCTKSKQQTFFYSWLFQFLKNPIKYLLSYHRVCDALLVQAHTPDHICSLLPPCCMFWGLNSGCQACTAGTFTLWATSLFTLVSF